MHRFKSFALTAALAVVLSAFDTAPAPAADDPAAQEAQLIAVLHGDAPGAEKAIACKKLAIYGSGAAVPELSKLLADEHLASWARIALEAIPGPAPDEALRQAQDTLKGRLLIGTINSIGVRRDAGAVERLTARLKDADAAVASASAAALGHIAGESATRTLRQALPSAPAEVRSAVAEGCILCAEQLLAGGKAPEAAQIYDEVRRSALPQQRIIEATRGAILARGAAGVPLLVEQLRSSDQGLFRVGLTTARELAGPEVADALATELVRTSPERAALLLTVLADRHDTRLPLAVLDAVKSGPKPVRIEALKVVGRLGDAASLSTLLDIASADDAELAQAAKAALVSLPGQNVNAEVAARLQSSDVRSLPVLVELVGQRRIAATPALVKALDNPNAQLRAAALTALGETISAKDLPVLIAAVVSPKDPADAPVALTALRTAAVRMPEREEVAGEISTALPRASQAAKNSLLETLGAVGGTKALATVAAAVKGDNESLQDTGSKLLGEWMTADAAPVLLDLAKSAPGDKYQVRALRGYIRIARQFALPLEKREEMCRQAMAASARPDEQKLVLIVLARYPSLEMLKQAVSAAGAPGLKDDASKAAMTIAQKLGGQNGEVRDLLAKIGLEPLKIEIVKAEYGAGDKQKDVTDVVRKATGEAPLITLPGANYNDVFGDPVNGVSKQLKIQYRIAGKLGEATFNENDPITLPTPK